MTGPEASNVLYSLSNQTTRPLPVDPTVPYDWRWMLKSIIGRPMIVLGLAALFMIVATMAVVMRTAEYQAVTTVSITNLRLAPGGGDAFYAEVQFDPTFLETQVYIISSETVINAVMRALAGKAESVAPIGSSAR